MKLTAYPFRPFELKRGQMNIIGTGSSLFYSRLSSLFIENKDDIQLFNETDKPLSPAKEVLWVGDPASNAAFDAIFMKSITKQLVTFMDDSDQIKLIDTAKELGRQVLEASYNLDIPLEIRDTAKIEAIVKFSGLHLAIPPVTNICAKIELLFKILEATGNEQLLVLTDVNHYVDIQELAELVEQVADSDLKVLLIEFSDRYLAEQYKNCQYYYVDADLVDFR